MTWKVEVKSIQGNPVLATQQDGAWLVWLEEDLWRVLTKPQRAAIEHGRLCGLVDAAFNTMLSLERRGLMHPDSRLTDAGKALAEWNERQS